MAVMKGDTVKVHYTGTLADGEVFDSSRGHDPLSFTVGSGQVIPGFSDAVLGMEVGEKKDVLIPVERAYGQRKEEMVLVAPVRQIPPGLDPEIGQILEVGGPGENSSGYGLLSLMTKISPLMPIPRWPGWI